MTKDMIESTQAILKEEMKEEPKRVGTISMSSCRWPHRCAKSGLERISHRSLSKLQCFGGMYRGMPTKAHNVGTRFHQGYDSTATNVISMLRHPNISLSSRIKVHSHAPELKFGLNRVRLGWAYAGAESPPHGLWAYSPALSAQVSDILTFYFDPIITLIQVCTEKPRPVPNCEQYWPCCVTWRGAPTTPSFAQSPTVPVLSMAHKVAVAASCVLEEWIVPPDFFHPAHWSGGLLAHSCKIPFLCTCTNILKACWRV